MSFVRYSETPSDASKPWNEPTGSSTSVSLYAVVASPSLQRLLGKGIDLSNLIESSDQILIVAQGSTDISQFSEVVDDGEIFGITDIQILKPGDTSLLSYVGVKR